MIPSLRPRPTPSAPAPFVPPLPVAVDGEDGRVVALDVPGDPFVDVRLLWPSGWGDEPEGADGLANLAARAITTATVDRDADAYACAVEALGASIDAGVSADAFQLRASALVDQLDGTLALALEGLERPRLDDDALGRLRREQADRRRRQLAEPERAAEEVLCATLYPASRHGRPAAGTSATLRSCDADAVGAFVSERLRLEDALLLVTGDLAVVDPAAVARDVFGTDRAITSAARRVPGGAADRPSGERQVVVVDRPGAVQSVIAAGHLGPSRHEDGLAPLWLAVEIVGGSFNSRLNQRLREERGFTYGIRMRQVAQRTTGRIVVRAAVETSVTAEALGEVERVVDRAVVYGVELQELDNARQQLVRLAPQRYETARGTAETVARELSLDVPPSRVGEVEAALPGVRVHEVNRALAYRLRPHAWTTVVVGDAARLREELAALDLGDVTVRDAPEV